MQHNKPIITVMVILKTQTQQVKTPAPFTSGRLADEINENACPESYEITKGDKLEPMHTFVRLGKPMQKHLYRVNILHFRDTVSYSGLFKESPSESIGYRGMGMLVWEMTYSAPDIVLIYGYH